MTRNKPIDYASVLETDSKISKTESDLKTAIVNIFNANSTEYVVKPGDTLHSIAKNCGGYKLVAFLNMLSGKKSFKTKEDGTIDYTLTPGQVIFLPKMDSSVNYVDYIKTISKYAKERQINTSITNQTINDQLLAEIIPDIFPKRPQNVSMYMLSSFVANHAQNIFSTNPIFIGSETVYSSKKDKTLQARKIASCAYMIKQLIIACFPLSSIPKDFYDNFINKKGMDTWQSLQMFKELGFENVGPILNTYFDKSKLGSGGEELIKSGSEKQYVKGLADMNKTIETSPNVTGFSELHIMYKHSGYRGVVAEFNRKQRSEGKGESFNGHKAAYIGKGEVTFEASQTPILKDGKFSKFEKRQTQQELKETQEKLQQAQKDISPQERSSLVAELEKQIPKGVPEEIVARYAQNSNKSTEEVKSILHTYDRNVIGDFLRNTYKKSSEAWFKGELDYIMNLLRKREIFEQQLKLIKKTEKKQEKGSDPFLQVYPVLKEYSSEYREFLDKIDKLQAEIKTLEKQIANNSEINKLQAEIKAIEEEISKKEAKKTDLLSRQKSISEEITKNQGNSSKILELSQSLSALQAGIANIDKEILALQKQIGGKKSDISTYTRNKEIQSGQIIENQRKIEEAKREALQNLNKIDPNLVGKFLKDNKYSPGVIANITFIITKPEGFKDSELSSYGLNSSQISKLKKLLLDQNKLKAELSTINGIQKQQYEPIIDTSKLNISENGLAEKISSYNSKAQKVNSLIGELQRANESLNSQRSMDIVDYMINFLIIRSDEPYIMFGKEKEKQEYRKKYLERLEQIGDIINLEIKRKTKSPPPENRTTTTTIKINLAQESKKAVKDRFHILPNDEVVIRGSQFVDGYHYAKADPRFDKETKDDMINRTRFGFEHLLNPTFFISEMIVPSTNPNSPSYFLRKSWEDGVKETGKQKENKNVSPEQTQLLDQRTLSFEIKRKKGYEESVKKFIVEVAERDTFSKLTEGTPEYNNKLQRFYSVQVKAMKLLGFINGDEEVNPQAFREGHGVLYFLDYEKVNQIYKNYINKQKNDYKKTNLDRINQRGNTFIAFKILDGDDKNSIIQRLLDCFVLDPKIKSQIAEIYPDQNDLNHLDKLIKSDIPREELYSKVVSNFPELEKKLGKEKLQDYLDKVRLLSKHPKLELLSNGLDEFSKNAFLYQVLSRSAPPKEKAKIEKIFSGELKIGMNIAISLEIIDDILSQLNSNTPFKVDSKKLSPLSNYIIRSTSQLETDRNFLSGSTLIESYVKDGYSPDIIPSGGLGGRKTKKVIGESLHEQTEFLKNFWSKVPNVNSFGTNQIQPKALNSGFNDQWLKRIDIMRAIQAVRDQKNFIENHDNVLTEIEASFTRAPANLMGAITGGHIMTSDMGIVDEIERLVYESDKYQINDNDSKEIIAEKNKKLSKIFEEMADRLKSLLRLGFMTNSNVVGQIFSASLAKSKYRQTSINLYGYLQSLGEITPELFQYLPNKNNTPEEQKKQQISAERMAGIQKLILIGNNSGDGRLQYILTENFAIRIFQSMLPNLRVPAIKFVDNDKYTYGYKTFLDHIKSFLEQVKGVKDLSEDQKVIITYFETFLSNVAQKTSPSKSEKENDTIIRGELSYILGNVEIKQILKKGNIDSSIIPNESEFTKIDDGKEQPDAKGLVPANHFRRKMFNYVRKIDDYPTYTPALFESKNIPQIK